MRGIFKKNTKFVNSTIPVDAQPRGIHHTVKMEESYNDTWNHIFSEIKKIGVSANEEVSFVNQEIYSYKELPKTERYRSLGHECAVAEMQNLCKPVHHVEIKLYTKNESVSAHESLSLELQNEVVCKEDAPDHLIDSLTIDSAQDLNLDLGTEKFIEQRAAFSAHENDKLHHNYEENEPIIHSQSIDQQILCDYETQNWSYYFSDNVSASNMEWYSSDESEYYQDLLLTNNSKSPEMEENVYQSSETKEEVSVKGTLDKKARNRDIVSSLPDINLGVDTFQKNHCKTTLNQSLNQLSPEYLSEILKEEFHPINPVLKAMDLPSLENNAVIH